MNSAQISVFRVRHGQLLADREVILLRLRRKPVDESRLEMLMRKFGMEDQLVGDWMDDGRTIDRLLNACDAVIRRANNKWEEEWIAFSDEYVKLMINGNAGGDYPTPHEFEKYPRIIEALERSAGLTVTGCYADFITNFREIFKDK